MGASANVWIVFLQPKYNVINPNANVPTMAANALIDPSQESCWQLSAPVFKGDSFDIRIGVAGDIQPIIDPWLMKIKFAIKSPK